MPYRTPILQATGSTDNTAVDGTMSTQNDAAARSDTINATRRADANIDANAGNMQQADTQRAMPRARTDNLNDASGRHLTPVGETIERPSTFSHRTNRRNANRAIARFNPGQKRTAAAFISPQNDRQRQIRDAINQHFESGGDLQSLGANTRRMVSQLDGAIQKAERENDRTHVVYTSMNVQNASASDFVAAMQRNPGQHQTLLGYTRANHDINKIDGDANTVYVQIETARGMYVGGDGSTGHLLPRGVELEFVHAGQFDVDNGQGGTDRKTIVQMREVRQNERTTART